MSTNDTRFAPKLKPARRLPFEFVRQCNICRKMSLYVNMSGDLSLICRNSFCRALNSKTYIPCVLQHRDHELNRFSMILDEEFAVLGTGPETPEIPEGTPDVENEVFSPTFAEGPYKDCNGVLVWDDSQRHTIDTWVKCNVCTLPYNIKIFTGFDLIGEHDFHSQYRILQDSKGSKRFSSRRDEWGSAARIFSPRLDVLMAVEEILYEGNRKVTECVPIIGIDY